MDGSLEKLQVQVNTKREREKERGMRWSVWNEFGGKILWTLEKSFLMAYQKSHSERERERVSSG